MRTFTRGNIFTGKDGAGMTDPEGSVTERRFCNNDGDFPPEAAVVVAKRIMKKRGERRDGGESGYGVGMD